MAGSQLAHYGPIRQLSRGRIAPRPERISHRTLEAALKPDKPFWDRDYGFGLVAVAFPAKSQFRVDTDAEVAELLAWVIDKALPALDRMRPVRTLDQFLSTVDPAGQFRDMPFDSFTALICAHLTCNPRLAELERRLRVVAKQSDDAPFSRMQTKHLDRLLAFAITSSRSMGRLHSRRRA
jgi:hypothetical protein